LGIALVVLLGLVAAASRAHHLPGTAGGIHRPPGGVIDYLFSIFMVLAVAATVALLWLWFSERDLLVQTRKRRQNRGMYKALVVLMVIALLASIVFRLWGPGGLLHHHGTSLLGKTNFGPHAKGHTSHNGLQGAPPPHFEWLPVFIALAAGTVLLAYIGSRAMRRVRGELLDKHLLDQQFESLLDETLDDLYLSQDPRAAIVAAYARMEKLFASAGVPRHAHEAPLEYLGRALEHLSASGAALGRLTGLFQWAKFSPHDVNQPMQEEAITALTQVRDELRAQRVETKAQREEAERFRAELQAAASDAERGRTFGEDPFAAAADKAKGSIYGRRGV